MRNLREFFAPPELLTTSGVAASASVEVAPRSHPAGPSSSPANMPIRVPAAAPNGSVSVLIPPLWVRLWDHITKWSMRTLSNRHTRRVLVVLAVVVTARLVRLLYVAIRSRRVLRRGEVASRRLERSAPSATPKRVFHIQQLDDSSDEASSVSTRASLLYRNIETVCDPTGVLSVALGCPVSRTPGALSDVSSVRASPSSQLDLLRQMAPSGEDTVAKDENGKMFVLHRNGAYVEVWEADEYGHVRDASLCYGDPDERCEELLDHFKREASLQLHHEADRSPSDLDTSSA